MSDIAVESATETRLTELERRVVSLESKVAALPSAPPPDPTLAPSFKDLQIPMPSVQNVVAAAKTTWTLFEMLGELNALFWTLFDRRYHMAWITRLITIALLVLIFTSHWWAPFAGYDNVVSNLIDKSVDLVLGLILFLVLSFETRRYKDWRKGRAL
jgi:hypothetical protein